MTDALSSHRAAVNWGIDTYSYRDVQGWDYADASAQWDVRRFAVWSEDGGASISELIRQRNARATVDSYEDILGGGRRRQCVRGWLRRGCPCRGFCG